MRMFYAVLIILMLFSFPVSAEEYVIGDGDVLGIAVWGEPDLSTEAIVRPDGMITMPAVGDTMAAGLSAAKLSEQLSAKLRKYVKRALVTVSVNKITNNKVYVFGGGVQSGAYELERRTTLLRFLAMLGDAKNADLRRSYVLRNGRKLDVNFYDIFAYGDFSKDIRLKPNDVIYIPDNEMNRIYVMGEVNKPQFIYHREGIKILDAILQAEGFTEYAKETRVIIFRDGVEKPINVKDLMKEGDLSQNVDLEPGDYVVVKESLF